MTASMTAFPPELIWNMALRYDHGLGCPDYYDMLGPGEHDKRCTLVKSAMGDILKYVLSKFYGSSLPQTPFKGLLEGMIAVCPVELHPTSTTMSQVYEEIVTYYNSAPVAQCKGVPREADPCEDNLNSPHQSDAEGRMDSPTSPPMPQVNEFPWGACNPAQINAHNPLLPVHQPSPSVHALIPLNDWANRAAQQLRNGVENATTLLDHLKKTTSSPPTRVEKFMLDTLAKDVEESNELLDELAHLIVSNS